MREEAADPTLVVDELLGPEPTSPTAPRPTASAARSEPTALRELMDWVSSEVFGGAEAA